MVTTVYQLLGIKIVYNFIHFHENIKDVILSTDFIVTNVEVVWLRKNKHHKKGATDTF